MKAKFKKYLSELGMSSALRQKAAEYYAMFMELDQGEITDILMSEHVNDDGARQYETLLFLNAANLIFEVEHFVEAPKIGLSPMTKRIVACQLIPRDYDFATPSELSRLQLNCYLVGDAFVLNYKASSQNCNYLRDFVKRRLLPNLVTSD